jgi:hypothetical protein
MEYYTTFKKKEIRAGDMAQMAEHLPRKCEALKFKPSYHPPPKKKPKEMLPFEISWMNLKDIMLSEIS